MGSGFGVRVFRVWRQVGEDGRNFGVGWVRLVDLGAMKAPGNWGFWV